MNYSNQRYTKVTPYRTEDLILPYTKFPSYQQIEKIQPVEPIQPYRPYQGLDDKRRALNRAKQQKQVQTFLSNYNDPTELNSYIDALTNREAVSKKFGDVWGTISTVSGTVAVLAFVGSIVAGAIQYAATPVTGGASAATGTATIAAGAAKAAATLAEIGAIAAIPAIPAAADVTYNKGIKPILAGKPKEALLNTLMNLGETMDTVSNPVKGLFLEGGEGFIKGTGLGPDGRINYDYDTGSVITDMLLETLSDPLNWVEWGSKSVLKTGFKAVAKPIAETYTRSAVHVVNNVLAKTVGKITEEGTENIIKKMKKVILTNL